MSREISEKVIEVTKEQLLPSLREKAQGVAEYVEKVLSEKDEKGLTASQISSLFVKRSANDIASCNSTYSPQELAIAFNIYVDMIQEINKYCKFPPNQSSFCQLLGITSQTYRNYLEDSDKCNIMRYIDDYISGVQLTSAQIGELQAIPTMFGLKAQHGFVEATSPVVIKRESVRSIEDIKAKMESIKGKVYEAEYDEK